MLNFKAMSHSTKEDFKDIVYGLAIIFIGLLAVSIFPAIFYFALGFSTVPAVFWGYVGAACFIVLTAIAHDIGRCRR